MKKRAFGAIAAVVLGSIATLAWSVPASAQEWMRDRRIGEGPGYEAGDFEIHPGIAGEVGYDSNYLIRSDKTGNNLTNGAPQAPPIGAGLLRITPSVSIASSATGERKEGQTIGEPPPVSFSGAVSGTYREFFQSDLQKERNMSANATAALTFLPGRVWSGSVNASYSRVIQPTVLNNPDVSYNNDTIVAGADLAVQPGVGTLDWHFGYTVTGTIFEDSGGTSYNNLLHTGYTRGRWKFRPKTALLYDGSIAARSFTNNNAVGAGFREHAMMPVRARIGLEGLVTSRFSMLGMIGYGGTFTTPDGPGDITVQQYDSVIGQLELRFFPGGGTADANSGGNGPQQQRASLLVSTIALGYNRDFIASYMGGYLGSDRGYLRAEYFFAGRFLVTLEGGVGALEHPNLYFAQAQTPGLGPQLMVNSYTDVHADGTLFMEYRVLQTLGINGTFSYVENFSNTLLPVTFNDVKTQQNMYDLNYRRIQAFLGVRWFM